MRSFHVHPRPGALAAIARWILAVAAFAAMSNAPAQSSAAGGREKPNILFILMDNLGYGEFGVYGGGVVRGAPTPRIDQLAAEGMRLTNFNVEAQCTPSRSAIMTGRFPIRSGDASQFRIGGEFARIDALGDNPAPRLLSASGYATGAFRQMASGQRPPAGCQTGQRFRRVVWHPTDDATKPFGRLARRRRPPALHRCTSWKDARGRDARDARRL